MADHLSRGIRLADMRRYRDAFRAFSQAINESNDSAPAYAMRGMTLINLGESRQAEKDIKTALHFDSEYPFAHYLMSYIWENKRNKYKAIAAAKEALRHNHSPDYLHRLGELYFASFQFIRSLDITEKSLAIDPMHEESIFLHAKTLKLLGRVDEAEELLHFALTINPENPQAYQELGAAALSKGKVLKSINLLQEARRISPELHHDRDSLASAYGKLIWPFNHLMSASVYCRELPKIKQWFFLAMIATALVVVLLVTKSTMKNWSLIAILAFSLATNLFGLLAVYDHYATAIARVVARRDLDLRWHQILMANIESSMTIVLFYAIATLLGICLGMNPGFAFFALTLVLSFYLFAGICKATGLFAWLLVPCAVVGMFALGVRGSLWIPERPFDVFAHWAVILAVTGVGSVLLHFSEHPGQKITSQVTPCNHT